MACSAGGVRVWECSLQGIGWQRERAGVRLASRKGFCKRPTIPETAKWFGNGGFDICARCLHTKSGRVSGWRVKTGSKAYVCKNQAEGRRRTVVSAYLEEEKDQRVNGKAQVESQLHKVLQKLNSILTLTPQRKSFVLLNVLAFIDGATAVVIKVTETNTGSEEAPAAGTSLMFLVRFMVGLLAFAPALAQRFSATSAVPAATSASEPLTSALTSALTPALSPSSGPDLGLVTAPPFEGLATGGNLNQEEGAGEMGGVSESAWETLYWPGMLSGVFMFLGDAGQAMGLETSTADHAAVLLTGSVILVPFLEAFSGRKIGLPVWLSALLAAAGMILLEQGSDIASSVSNGPWDLSLSHMLQSIPIGDCWCLTSSVGFALYMVLSEEQCTRTDPLRLAAVQLATTVVLSALWEAWDLQHNGGGAGGALLLRHLAAMPWAAVFFIGVIGTGLASWMELQALQTVNSTTATLVYTTGPLWSAILAYVALGETMDAVSCGGAALILLASIGTQVFSPPKTVRTGRALAQPLVGAAADSSKDRRTEVDKIAVGSKEGPERADSVVEMIHKMTERRGSQLPPSLKLLPIRAVAERPRLLSRKKIVPHLRKLFRR